MAFLEVKNVTKTYDSGILIGPQSLKMDHGEIIVLTGASGQGKTSLLRMIVGLEKPESGTVHLDGKLLSGEGDWCPTQEREVGLVFQEYVLFPHLTIKDNITFGLQSLNAVERKKRMQELLQLDSYEKRFPDELSGGEKQRVALVRALAPQPKLLLMDEAFSGLHEELRLEIIKETMKVLRGVQMTMLCVTHNPKEIEPFVDRCVDMGEVIGQQ